jgi:hypothetical protein
MSCVYKSPVAFAGLFIAHDEHTCQVFRDVVFDYFTQRWVLKILFFESDDLKGSYLEFRHSKTKNPSLPIL